VKQTIQGTLFEPVLYCPGAAGNPPEYHEDNSGWKGPIGYDYLESTLYSVEHTFTALPEPLDVITISVEAYADLGASNEYFSVYINDNLAGVIFEDAIYGCSGANAADIEVSMEDWVSWVGEGDAVIRATPTNDVEAYDQTCDSQGSRAKISIRFKKTEAVSFIPGKGPSFIRYRTPEPVRFGNGTTDYMWAELTWDHVLKHYVWKVDCSPLDKRGYGGISLDAVTAVFSACIAFHYRPQLVRFTAAGECILI
jgi:hypothetical protein